MFKLNKGDKLVLYGLVYLIVIWTLCLITIQVKRVPTPMVGQKTLDEILRCVKGAE